MSSRRRVSARVARRRALLVDLICGLVLAIVAIALAAGIGVVGLGALLTLAVVLAWVGAETLLRRRRPH